MNDILLTAQQSVGKLPDAPWDTSITIATHIGFFEGKQKSPHIVAWTWTGSDKTTTHTYEDIAVAVGPQSFGACLLYLAEDEPKLKTDCVDILQALYIRYHRTSMLNES